MSVSVKKISQYPMAILAEVHGIPDFAEAVEVIERELQVKREDVSINRYHGSDHSCWLVIHPIGKQVEERIIITKE